MSRRLVVTFLENFDIVPNTIIVWIHFGLQCDKCTLSYTLFPIYNYKMISFYARIYTSVYASNLNHLRYQGGGCVSRFLPLSHQLTYSRNNLVCVFIGSASIIDLRHNNNFMTIGSILSFTNSKFSYSNEFCCWYTHCLQQW